MDIEQAKELVAYNGGTIKPFNGPAPTEPGEGLHAIYFSPMLQTRLRNASHMTISSWYVFKDVSEIDWLLKLMVQPA